MPYGYQIGGLAMGPGAALAPMAGVSDLTMRRLCAGFGAVFTVSEMVSAKALTMQDRKSLALLRGRGGTAPYAVQLFGNEPDVMAEAVALIADEDFDFLDLNMGCPAPKICGHGAGSGLLKDPPLAAHLARRAVAASARPVTVKMRTGWDAETQTGGELARRLEEAGVALLCVHGRTRAQQFQPGVDYDAVAAIKAAVSIPVLYNGDVGSAAAALLALQRTGCDGMMVGRAAMGNPWLFGEIAAAMAGQPAPAPPTLYQRLETLREQVAGMCEEKGEERAMREARKVAAAYLKGLHGAAALRHQAHSLSYFTDLDGLFAEVYRHNA